MPIIRVKPRNYSIIANTALKDTSLSARAKGVYAYIMSLPDDWVLRKRELPRHFKEGNKAIWTAFKELEDAGYVVKTVVRDEENKKLNGWNWMVFSEPQVSPGEPGSDCSRPDCSIPDHSESGSYQLLNNKVLNTKQKVPELEGSRSGVSFSEDRSGSRKKNQVGLTELYELMLEWFIPYREDSCGQTLQYPDEAHATMDATSFMKGCTNGITKKELKMLEALIVMLCRIPRDVWPRLDEIREQVYNGSTLRKHYADLVLCYLSASQGTGIPQTALGGWKDIMGEYSNVKLN